MTAVRSLEPGFSLWPCPSSPDAQGLARESQVWADLQGEPLSHGPHSKEPVPLRDQTGIAVTERSELCNTSCFGGKH